MITVEHLTKCYGDFMAVRDLSFEIEEGHVYGFLGPNGAGKSTTMNIMTGCLSPTSGHVRINGHDILEEPEEAKKNIGYLPELPPLYMSETPAEYLRFVGEAKGVRGEALKKQIEDVIRLTGLEQMKDRLISALSKGYKQRVGIAQALLGSPKVIILDEPTVGLDPIQIVEIRDLIRSLGETHTVIFSSHILSEVQEICEKVIIISHGELVAFDTPDNLGSLLNETQEIRIKALAGQEVVEKALASIEGLDSWVFEDEDGEEGASIVSVRTDLEDTPELRRSIFMAFAAQSAPIMEMNTNKVSLEDIFIELTEDEKGKTPEETQDMPKASGETDASPAERTESEVKE